MINKLIIILLLFTIKSLNAQKIYQVMYEDECDVKICIVNDASKCDLKVFFVDDEKKSVKPGCWYVCDFIEYADKKIFITEDTLKADIKIFIVEKESDSGWVNKAKKGKL